MSARVDDTAAGPSDAAPFDAATLQILWGRLISAVDEASAALVRTAFSSVVRESYDFACVVTDARGHLVAQATQSIPSFIGTLPRTVRWFQELYPAEKLTPGDVLISNDPWHGTGHLPDINVVKPIFLGERLIGFAASTAHAPDIGGRTGSLEMRDIYEEGFQIPPMKLITGGKVNQSLVSLLRANVRAPDDVVGDLWAQITGLDIIEQRTLSLMEEYGFAELTALADEIHDRSEAAMRAAIAKAPRGTWRYAVTADGGPMPIEIRIAVSFTGEEVVIDFEGSSGEVAGMNMNAVYAYTYAYTSYGVKCILAPDLPNNDGVWRPIVIKAPEGSVLNHRFPIAGYSRHMVGHYLPLSVLAALAEALPDRVMAPSGTPVWNVKVSGVDDAGRSFASLLFFNGGMGANARRDGESVLSWPSNISGVPVEYMERSTPWRIRYKRYAEGSGGAGEQRGGLGQELMFESRSERPLNLHFSAGRSSIDPEGICGGGPGRRGELRINGAAPLDPSKPYRLLNGDTLYLRTPGGGGFGDPGRRAADRTEADRTEGYTDSGGAANGT